MCMLTDYELYHLKKAINAASYDYPYREKVYNSILTKLEIMSEESKKVKDIFIEEQKIASKY